MSKWLPTWWNEGRREYTIQWIRVHYHSHSSGLGMNVESLSFFLSLPCVWLPPLFSMYFLSNSSCSRRALILCKSHLQWSLYMKFHLEWSEYSYLWSDSQMQPFQLTETRETAIGLMLLVAHLFLLFSSSSNLLCRFRNDSSDTS